MTAQSQMPAWMQDLPKSVDEAWRRLDLYLSSLPNDIERQKAVRLLRRRLAHPEASQPGTIAYGEREIERENSAPRTYRPPTGSSPPCVCGAPRGLHDPITGEYPRNGCDGFYPEPV